MTDTIGISRTITIDAGHRLQDHGGKCKHLHGHRYTISCYVEGPQDEHGMVLGFAALKSIMWRVVGPYDHCMMLERMDMVAEHLLGMEDTGLFIVNFPPTAENLAAFWGGKINKAVKRKTKGACSVGSLVVQETENCMATWTPADAEDVE